MSRLRNERFCDHLLRSIISIERFITSRWQSAGVRVLLTGTRGYVLGGGFELIFICRLSFDLERLAVVPVVLHKLARIVPRGDMDKAASSGV